MTVAKRGEVYTYLDKIIGMLSKTIEPLWFHVEVFVLFFLLVVASGNVLEDKD